MPETSHAARFDAKTGDIKLFVDPLTNVQSAYCPQVGICFALGNLHPALTYQHQIWADVHCSCHQPFSTIVLQHCMTTYLSIP